MLEVTQFVKISGLWVRRFLVLPRSRFINDTHIEKILKYDLLIVLQKV